MRIFHKFSLFQKVHWKLTLLFTGIAGFILVLLSVSYLLMSEREWKDYSYLSFLRESEAIVSNLSQQKTVQNRWLVEVTENKHYLLAVYDNGVPLHFTDMTLSLHEKMLADCFLSLAIEDFSASTDSDYTTLHTDFSYKQTDGTVYDVYAAKLGSKSAPLYVIIFASTAELHERLAKQRLRFMLIDISGILFLFLFSYFYTKKLLSPIQENQKQQNAFLAAASHELRTPIAAMLCALSAYHSADCKMKAQFVAILEHESKRMSSLVNDMLSLSRADNHTWVFHMQKTELDTLLLNTYETFLPLAKEQNCILSVTLPEEALPPCICDSERIEQVLFILLNNAISYGILGSDTSVQMKLSFSNNTFEIKVTDHGPGITEAEKQHIFDRFYRADSARSAGEHFGLGLCIAKEIMDAHDGQITINDTPGGGATFCVRLHTVDTESRYWLSRVKKV